MEMYTYKQMATDLQCFLSKDPNFLDCPDLPADPYSLTLIGFGLRRRYYRNGCIDDMKRALVVLEIAIQKAPVASPDWLNSVRILTRTCYLYYHKTLNIYHLDQAIRLSEQLIEHIDLQSPLLVSSLHYLALYLVVRGQKTQNTADLQRAGRAWRECLLYTPQTSQNRNIYISRLFYCLLLSYHREGDVIGLEEAINLLHLLLDEKPIEASKCPMIIAFLADQMLECYFRSQQISDMHTIINVWEQVIASTPAQTLYLPDLNRMLSIAYLSRFLLLKHDDDLQRAVATQEEAFYLCKAGTPPYLQNLHDLGQILLLRHYRTLSLVDLNRAIESFEQAFSTLSGSSSSIKSACRKNLIAALHLRYMHTADNRDFKRIQQIRLQR